jgi:hypothetical protein
MQETIVKSLAESQDGRSWNSNSVNPFAFIPETEPSTPLHLQDDMIREHLGNQRTVIVRAHLDGPGSFSKEEIGAVKGPLNQKVEWHGGSKCLKVITGVNFLFKMRKSLR